jgi:heme-degrading monooxygenase HmoA
MIARVWRGVAAPETAHEYLEHLQGTVFPELFAIAGYQGASVLRRDIDTGVEFTVQTLWESIDAIRQFAGDQVETAVVAPAAQPLFRSYDHTVTHYEVVLTAQATSDK